MHVSKSKANTAYICGDVFVCNYQFVMTFNACFSVVMNRLTDVVSQGSVMTFIRSGGKFCHCFVANSFRYVCAKHIKIEVI